MTDLLANVAVPLATDDDAVATARALARVLPAGATVTAVHVIETTAGAPDKASPEARSEDAAEIFAAFEETLAAAGADATVRTRTVYSGDVVDGVLEVAGDLDASAVAFVPRRGSRLVRFLAGDVALELVEAADRPVVSLPEPAGDAGSAGASDTQQSTEHSDDE